MQLNNRVDWVKYWDLRVFKYILICPNFILDIVTEKALNTEN